MKKSWSICTEVNEQLNRLKYPDSKNMKVRKVMTFPLVPLF